MAPFLERRVLPGFGGQLRGEPLPGGGIASGPLGWLSINKAGWVRYPPGFYEEFGRGPYRKKRDNCPKPRPLGHRREQPISCDRLKIRGH